MKEKIRVFIVDDSVMFRSQIPLALSLDERIEVVGTATNGKSALQKMSDLNVDLVILDMEMPVMDGVDTVKELTKCRPRPKILLYSSLQDQGEKKISDALSWGATAYLAKPVCGDSGLTPAQKIKEKLLPKILGLFSSVPAPQKVLSGSSYHPPFMWESFLPRVLVVASSTGGPSALYELFSHLKDPLPFPILITQHMPPLFTRTLAQKLAEITGKEAHEGQDGELLCPDKIYVAPGNFHMALEGSADQATVRVFQGELRNFVRPCADYLFESAAEIFNEQTMGVVLTGMGRDGADGAATIKGKNGAVLIQDQASSVVFGMPGAIFESGAFDFMGTPTDLAIKIRTISNKKATDAA